MDVIFIVLPLALAMTVLFVAVFAWATMRGQFDDTKTPALRAVFDDPSRGSSPAAQPPGVITEPRPDAQSAPPAP